MQSLFSRTLLSLLFVSLLLSVGCADHEPSALSNDITEITATIDTVAEEVQQAPQLPHLELAESYVGTQELTGQNDGPEIERFLASVSLSAGNPYCAAFVSFVLDETPEVEQPTVRSGLAYHFITDQSIEAKEVLRGTTTVDPGTILVWRKGNTIYGHTGFVADQTETNQFLTVEANTSSGVYGNQRDGDGVWQRQRSIEPGNYFRITHFTRVVYA